ncbi:MAG: hypothetical protein H7Y61_20820 [Rhizobiales bacterium]|nr:hypothetical protein [Rhizobacter sp.]
MEALQIRAFGANRTGLPTKLSTTAVDALPILRENFAWAWMRRRNGSVADA